jgi:hypothetical protein
MNHSIRPLVVMALLFASPSAVMSSAQDPGARIKGASGVFLGTTDSSTTKASVLDALLELLDVTASLTREAQYSAEIKHRIDVARNLFEEDSIFNAKARQYLSFAYRMLTDGKKYERPRELEEFVTPAEAREKARKHAQKLVADALARLEEEDRVGAATLLLELVLMVVTPVPG